jgi:hypothetical protein
MINATISNRRKFFYYPLLLLLAAGIGLLVTVSNYSWQGTVIVAAAIGILAALLIPRLSRFQADTFLFGVLVWALVMRLVFAMINYWFGFYVYSGSTDASLYYGTGIYLSDYIKSLDFNHLASYLKFGTSFVEFFSGLVSIITGPTIQGDYLVFALLGFLGSYYFYKAFRVAFSQGNKLLYALLVFFYPSILFWASGIGKDSLIFLFLGLLAYGGARIVKEQLSGILPLAIGLVGTLYVRPHIAAIAVIAFVTAFLVHGIGKKAMRPTTFVIGLLVVGALAWFVLPRIINFLEIEELSPQSVLDRLQYQQAFTTSGGSEFGVSRLNNPLAYPLAVATLLFRPFPWEVNNIQAAAESLEGLFIIGLVFWQFKGIGRAFAQSISETYTRFLLILFAGFIILTAMIGNFGIIVRERVMFWPFFFMLIAYTPSRREKREEVNACSSLPQVVEPASQTGES